VADLEEKVRDLGAITVPVSTLAPEPYEVLRQFEIIVRPEEDSFVATLFDAGIHASGETRQDAVTNLKDMMIGLFETLPARKLAEGPARQLAVLRELIRKKS
jgi:hypothetical protein